MGSQLKRISVMFIFFVFLPSVHKEIMMTLETKLADNQKVIEREEGVNSRPGWIKKTAIGLAAVVGLGIGSANLPNDYVNIGPTSAYAEESTLNIPSLNEGNYRQVINKEPVCFVMYYRSDTQRDRGTRYMDDFVSELKNSVNSNIPFYKVDVSNFTNSLERQAIIKDIHENTIPTIILYKKGYSVEQGRGYPLKKEYNSWIQEFRNKI